MRALSAWFSYHKYAAWLVIAISHFVFFLMAMQLAGSLQLLPYVIPGAWFWVAIIACAALAYLAGVVKQRYAFSVCSRAGYALVRTRYAMVLLGSYIMISGWFYHDLHIRYSDSQQLYGSLSVKEVSGKVQQQKGNRDFRHFYKQQKQRLSLKELKQVLREAKQLRRQSGNPGSQQSLAIFGIVLLALMLSALVLAGACNLSCAGSGTGAVLVGVLGMGLIIWGTVAWIKHVNKKARETADAANKTAAAAPTGVPSNDAMQ